MCKCENINIGSDDNQIELKSPSFMKAIGNIGCLTICDTTRIDTCLRDEIMFLWSQNICTTGCCCGHNHQKGYIGVSEHNRAVEKMKALGYVEDLRFPLTFAPKSLDVVITNDLIDDLRERGHGQGDAHAALIKCFGDINLAEGWILTARGAQNTDGDEFAKEGYHWRLAGLVKSQKENFELELNKPDKMENPEDIPSLRQDLTLGQLQKLEKRGMIPKHKLKDGGVYLGNCRNATVARWDKNIDKFVHWRSKWGSIFEETIHHPEDDNGYDLFVPIKELPTEDYKKPQTK